jgi:putative oxidoreductase
MLDKLKALRERLLERVHRIEGFGPLLARVTLGVVFMSTGWGKLHSLGQVTRFFTELHLPAPAFMAGLVAVAELFGGLFILVGLLTRLAALPLVVTMIVAILTAKRDDIKGVVTLLGFEEWSYLVLFVWLMLAGPGPFSLDALLARRLGRGRAPRPTAGPVASRPPLPST